MLTCSSKRFQCMLNSRMDSRWISMMCNTPSCKFDTTLKTRVHLGDKCCSNVDVLGCWNVVCRARAGAPKHFWYAIRQTCHILQPIQGRHYGTLGHTYRHRTAPGGERICRACVDGDSISKKIRPASHLLHLRVCLLLCLFFIAAQVVARLIAELWLLTPPTACMHACMHMRICAYATLDAGRLYYRMKSR